MIKKAQKLLNNNMFLNLSNRHIFMDNSGRFPFRYLYFSHCPAMCHVSTNLVISPRTKDTVYMEHSKSSKMLRKERIFVFGLFLLNCLSF